ncbi:ATP-binding cassette domain-containing protein [Geomonas sp. RF6]|uniref:ABC transporter ATP-binding protein n=1 Tax=Geomonas sp. RF6 TaxID=2897342 RepID=UPI001E4CEC52|nr:ABC transporter ATP-binding protein [Geomonas sp. RF6]UFS70979.1 ATP-binding cassette domain-containing protein [Geomonas sp. RF6]
MGTFLEVEGFSHTFHGAPGAALSDVSLDVRSGECVCLAGQSGCGKTTLLMAVKGLLRGGESSGEIRYPQWQDTGLSGGVGLVFQNVETQILCSTVAQEVAFGPENLCLSEIEITRRVRRALQATNLVNYAARSVERFSAGQKQRIAIAAALAMEPRLLILDEPTSQLDDEGKTELIGVLAELKRQGYTLLIAEHNLKPLQRIADRYLYMENGRIAGESCRCPHFCEPTQPDAAPQREPSIGAPAIEVRGVSLSYPETGTVLSKVSLQVPAGARVHLTGLNGAGKSSLLRCLAGVEVGDTGTVVIAGIDKPRPGRLLGKVGLLVQNPGRQLFENTVTEEVAFSLKRMEMPAALRDDAIREALELCEISHLAGRAPLTLSFGEQHRVALASVLAPRPEVLLLDEPFAGLDWEQRLRLLHILYGLPQRFGTTVVIASHDPLPAQWWADRTVLLEGGTVAAA